jgi:1A family penicillin-binding protein
MVDPWLSAPAGGGSDAGPGRLYTTLVTLLRLIAALALVAIVLPPVAGAVAVTTLVKGPLPVGDLPEEKDLVTAEPSLVYDATGRQIGLFRGFDQSREIEPSEVPEILEDAVVAIEDQRFWEHDGVDYEGIARAARTNLEVGGVAQGGSTITQQYVKNVYLSNEQTLERKVQEALLAVEVEKQLSKEEILFGYLTSSYFGSGAYGIGAAAEIYFDKSVSELDVSEAATLAGVVKAPTRLSPFVDREAAEERRRLVLQAMLDQGYIDEAQHEREARRRLWSADDGDAPGGPVTLLVPRAAKGALHYPYFVDHVEAELLDRLGPDLVYNGGLTIETTIDPTIQEAAEAAVAERLAGTEYPVEMASATIDQATGHIVAMVGGRDHGASQVNLATGGSTGFQPGSSFKPLVLARAFEMGLGPETNYPAPASWTVPGCSGSQCTLSNYDHRGRGNLSLRAAMHASVNTVFAQLVLDVGIDETVDLARRLGLERLDPDRFYGPSLALGAAESSPLEMASAYGTFANRGVRVAPTGILRVVDRDGNVLIDNRARPGTRVVSEVTADNVTDVLVGVIESGTGRRAALDRPAAGKTGTAQAYRAAWFVGYTPQYTTAVWMGHADHLASLRNINGVGRVTGGSHPAIAWQEIMTAAHEGLEVIEFPEPAEIVPIAASVDELEPFRHREFTEAAPRRSRPVLSADCGDRSCQRRSAPLPAVPAPTAPPATIPTEPTTVTTVDGSPTTPVDPSPTSTSTSTSTSSTSTSTATTSTTTPTP